MVLFQFLILIAFYLRISSAQSCPSGQKPSSTFKGKCVNQNISCDGYLLQVSGNCSTVQLDTQAQYSISSSSITSAVYCTLATGNDALKTVYMCISCPNTTPLRLGSGCVSCKSDEYQYFVNLKQVECIKKSDQGNPNYRGYLTVDKTSVVSECNWLEQIYEEENALYGTALKLISQCSKCTAGTYPNAERTKCTQCNIPGFVVYNNICQQKPSQCSMLSLNQSTGTYFCKSNCYTGTVAIKKDDNLIYCDKCPSNMPYYLKNTLSCIDSCPDSMLYYQQECIRQYPVAAGQQFGLLASNGQVVIMQNLCASNFTISSNAFYIDQNKKAADGNYFICQSCPDNTPFLNSSDPQKCVGCPDNQIFDYTNRKCVVTSTVNINDFNVSMDKKAFFPKSFCPTGQYRSSNVCTPCSLNTKPSLNQQFCCAANQMFNEVLNKCEVDNRFCKICMNGTLLGDFNCVQQCPSNYITQERTDSNGCFVNVPKQYQCVPCNKERQMIKNNICLSDCDTGYTYSKKLKKCILIDDCDGYFVNNNYKDCLEIIPFTPFNYKTRTPSFITKKKGKSATEYITCSNDQPFVEISQPSGITVCTRCLERIRDYETGKCVSSLDEIITPQKGTFLYKRLEYWPKVYYQLDACKSPAAYFLNKSLGMKECTYEATDSSSCNGITEIFDNRTKNCVSSNMCSLVLSRDEKTCSLAACKEDEIYQVLPIGNSDLPEKNNYGYLYKCYLCPSDRPYKEGRENNTCNSTCPADKIINMSGTLCIDKTQCQGFISITGRECLLKCPQNQFISSNQCVERCPQGLIPDLQSSRCIMLNQCKNFISTKNECIQQCPLSHFKFVQQQGEYQLNYCFEKCPEKTYIDPSSQQCKPWSFCTLTMRNKLSFDRARCVDMCPQYQIIDNIIEQGIKIDVCKACPENSYYQSQSGVAECVSNCGQDIIDLETKSCILPENCKGVISYDKKYCEKSCSFGIQILLKNSLVPECFCPQDKPYLDYELKVCTDKCKIYFHGDVFMKKMCLKDFQSCEHHLNKINEESYECLDKCPQISEQECFSCPSICKSCSTQTPIIHENKCYDQCPQPLVYYSNLKRCIDETCPIFQIFDTEELHCVNVVDCDKKGLTVDLTNMRCVKECTRDYQFTPKDEQSSCMNKYQNDKQDNIFGGRGGDQGVSPVGGFGEGKPGGGQVGSPVGGQERGGGTGGGGSGGGEPNEKDTTNSACIFSDPPGTFNSCQKEKICNPPRFQILLNDKILCVRNITQYGYVFDKITSNSRQYYGIEPKLCKGFLSSQQIHGEQEFCQIQCQSGERVVNDSRGSLKCVLCPFFLQYIKEKNTVECVRQCGKGYIANSNNVCLPYQSECSGNKMLSSDGLQCSDECVFPDYNKDGKCTRWKSTDFQSSCTTVIQDQILDTTTLPPYKCISKQQCSGSIVDQRCVVVCLDSNCLNAALTEDMNITLKSKFVLDQIQINDGIVSIQTLNDALMGLDWFAIHVADSLSQKNGDAQELLKSIKQLSQTVAANDFLLSIKDEGYSNFCKNYQYKIGTTVFPLYEEQEVYPWYCTVRKRLSPSKLNIQYQNMIFGRPDVIQVVYQKIQKSFQLKMLIDTTEYGKDYKSIISYKSKIADLNYSLNDKEILVVHIKVNPFCNGESSCKDYPLIYIDVTSTITKQLQIKFALNKDYPNVACAYYEYNNGNSKIADTNPGCITEDQKFIICPYSISEATISYFSLIQKDKKSEFQFYKICSKKLIVDQDSDNDFGGEMSQSSSLKEGIAQNKSINGDISRSQQLGNSSGGGKDEELSQIQVAVISIFSFAFFQLFVFGAYLILKKYIDKQCSVEQKKVNLNMLSKVDENKPHLHQKKATNTTTRLKQEDIESSQQPQTQNQIETATHI